MELILYKTTERICQTVRNCFLVVEGESLPETVQEKSVRGRDRNGKRKVQTSVERRRLDRAGNGLDVGMRRLRAGRNGGQNDRWSCGVVVLHFGIGRVFVFG